MRQALARGGVLIAAASVALFSLLRPPVDLPEEAHRGVAREALRLAPPSESSCEDSDQALTLPTGAPTALGCDDARTITAQARSTLAAPGAPVDPAAFAEATSDWLDPHGLWSVAPDAPVGALVGKRASDLLAEIEVAPGSGRCRTAEALGAALLEWSATLRADFDASYAEATHGLRLPALGDEAVAAALPPPARAPSAAAFRLAASSPFEEGPVTRSARDLMRSLGHDIGAIRLAYGPVIEPFASRARDRSAPELDAEEWGRVVIAAALRAYIPQIDAHGAWAPLDEELSIYDLDLEASPPPRLWGEMTRTALGVRIDRAAMAPLLQGDVVLRVQETTLAGVSVEQVQQFSVLPEGSPVEVTVLREGSAAPLSLRVSEIAYAPGEAAPAASIEPEMVRYADGLVAVIPIFDVPDDLGDRVASALEKARRAGPLRGVVLDVRDNGGGSTDGATAAIGLFLPGATLFPMRRRDGGIEVERAPEGDRRRQWAGPLSVLVDGDSASAAEMIAGAIAAYHRGVVVGDRTYGKGCAQEYLDDDARVGVLRLTTLLYALPDGSPVQKVGIQPELTLSLPPAIEREAMTERALGPWRGPDVRDRELVREVPWPSHAGRVGPCHDETVCRALRALGATTAAAR